MNISSLQILLQESIDNTTSSMDYLLLSKAIQSLNMGQIRSVAAFTNLPTASSNEGLLVFVAADERLYWSDGVSWYGIATDNEGRVWSWGDGTDGALGKGDTTKENQPYSVIGGFTDWCQVSAGLGNHSLGLRSNGTAWAWGYNGSGQLGNNSITNRCSPVSVVGGFTNWYQISAGCYYSLGLRSNGTIWGWGANNVGQLGDCTVTSKSSPVSVVGGFTDWCQVSAGGYHTLAVRCNGTAWAWGCNSNGQLGDNTASNNSSPVSIVGGFTNWCQVSAGCRYSLGLRTNGTAWAWGANNVGQLGDCTVTSKSSPVSIVGGFTDWCQVSAGSGHSLGLRTSGIAWAWGCGARGQLGDCTNVNKSSPVSVVGGFTDWCQVDAGCAHTLAVRTNGTAWAWGCNVCSQLGDNGSSNNSSPVSVFGGFTDWCQVSAGDTHSHAIRKSNFV